MTPKSFWIIVIRILGLYFIFQAAVLIPQLLTQIALGSRSSYGVDLGSIIATLAITAIIILLLLIIIRYCIYKPVWLIDKLKLDNGFDEEVIELKADQFKVLNVAIIVIGGVMIADALPLFCKTTFFYFQKINTYSYFKDYPEASWLIYYAIKSIIGYLMIAFSRNITLFIEKRSDKMGA